MRARGMQTHPHHDARKVHTDIGRLHTKCGVELPRRTGVREPRVSGEGVLRYFDGARAVYLAAGSPVTCERCKRGV